ncbi:MAG TPA: DegV family protein [Gaiellaceae bacterium]|nr:DegV family protein [Gaiellaceae bacterium]
MIAICTDSSSQLAAADAAMLGIDVVPAVIVLDGEEHDETELDAEALYERLAAGARATTSQPSPGRFAETYERAAQRGAHAIVSIHLDARASGTLASAELAAADARVPVTVVDAGTASYGVAVVAARAARLAAAGATAAEVAADAAGRGSRLENLFFAAGAARGRVPSSGGALLAFAGGATEVVGSSGPADVPRLIAERLAEAAPPLRVAVGHAARDVEPLADELAARARAIGGAVDRYRVGPSVGAHTGPLAFGAFWWRADD